MNPRAWKALAVIACLATLGSASAALADLTQKGTLRLSVTGKLAPKKLPREKPAPIAVSVGWNMATTDGSAPPKLKKLRIEINRNGRFDYDGLEVCPVGKIQPASTKRALSNCRPSLIGEGKFSAQVALAGQEAYPTQGKLLVFNGLLGGKPVLLGHIYSAHPFATSFIIPFRLSKISHGTYGTALEATLPKSLSSWGNLTGIEMKLSRRFHHEGRSHSYLSAACPAPKGFSVALFALARTSFSFTGGKTITSTLTDDCKVRG